MSHGDAVVGLIRVDPGDTAITLALQTLHVSGVRRVIIVDALRGKEQYAAEGALKDNRFIVFYETSEDGVERILAESAKDASYVFDVPPCFSYPTKGLVEMAVRTMQVQKDVRQVGLAPRYLTPPAHAATAFLMLLTHAIWMWFSFLNRWRDYRGTYAVFKAVARECNMATVATGNKAAWKKVEAATVTPAPGLAPVYEFLRVMVREETGWRRWILLFIYLRLCSFPWIALAKQQPLRELFPPALIAFWLIQALCVLMLAHQYFPNAPHSLVHALTLPFFVGPWILLLLYAKTLWRGYQGEMPTMHWPEMPTLLAPDGSGDVPAPAAE